VFYGRELVPCDSFVMGETEMGWAGLAGGVSDFRTELGVFWRALIRGKIVVVFRLRWEVDRGVGG